MDYEQRLTELVKSAMKSGEKGRLMALRSIKSVILTERTKSSEPLTDERAIQAISSHRKKMLNALEQYRDSGRQDLIDGAELEIVVCDELLPQRLDEAQVEAMIDEAISETGASGMGDIGKIMGPVMKKAAGRADGNLVRQIATRKLGG